MKRWALIGLMALFASAAFPQAASWWRIPAVGSGPGAHGSYWASDLYLFNPNAEEITVNVVLIHATGSFGPVGIRVPAGGSYTLEDAMVPFELQGAGALEVMTGDFAQFYVMSRTYNTEADGDTQGQDVAGQDWCLGQGPDGLGEKLLFLGIQQTLQFRTNFGFVTDETPVDLVLDVYEDRGVLVVSIPIHLDRFTAVQFNLATYTGAAVNNGYAVARMVSSSFACVNGYASVVDNGTQDGTYIGGQLIPAPAR
jgi:hypothetical protein